MNQTSLSTKLHKEIEVKEIGGSKRRPLRFLVNKEIIVGFSHHAVKRIRERDLDPLSIIETMAGKNRKEWKQLGIIAEYKPYQKCVNIITC